MTRIRVLTSGWSFVYDGTYVAWHEDDLGLYGWDYSDIQLETQFHVHLFHFDMEHDDIIFLNWEVAS